LWVADFFARAKIKAAFPAALLIQLSRCNPHLSTPFELSKSANRAHSCLFGWCGSHEQFRFVAKVIQYFL